MFLEAVSTRHRTRTGARVSGRHRVRRVGEGRTCREHQGCCRRSGRSSGRSTAGQQGRAGQFARSGSSEENRGCAACVGRCAARSPDDVVGTDSAEAPAGQSEATESGASPPCSASSLPSTSAKEVVPSCLPTLIEALSPSRYVSASPVPSAVVDHPRNALPGGWSAGAPGLDPLRRTLAAATEAQLARERARKGTEGASLLTAIFASLVLSLKTSPRPLSLLRPVSRRQTTFSPGRTRAPSPAADPTARPPPQQRPNGPPSPLASPGTLADGAHTPLLPSSSVASSANAYASTSSSAPRPASPDAAGASSLRQLGRLQPSARPAPPPLACDALRDNPSLLPGMSLAPPEPLAGGSRFWENLSLESLEEASLALLLGREATPATAAEAPLAGPPSATTNAAGRTSSTSSRHQRPTSIALPSPPRIPAAAKPASPLSPKLYSWNFLRRAGGSAAAAAAPTTPASSSSSGKTGSSGVPPNRTIEIASAPPRKHRSSLTLPEHTTFDLEEARLVQGGDEDVSASAAGAGAGPSGDASAASAPATASSSALPDRPQRPGPSRVRPLLLLEPWDPEVGVARPSPSFHISRLTTQSVRFISHRRGPTACRPSGPLPSARSRQRQPPCA